MITEGVPVTAIFEALEDAIKSDDPEAARGFAGLLAAHQCLDLLNPEGATPLIVAADHGHLGLCELLLQAGASAGARDQYGRTASAAFGILAEENGDERAPGEAECHRSDLLFAAYGAGTRPAIYVVAYLGGIDIRGVEANDRFWRFKRSLKEALRAEGLPAPRAERVNEMRLFLWLEEGEVEDAREVVRRAAAKAEYGDDVTFKTLAEAGPCA